MANPVIQWQILSKNPETSESFYRELFDWQVSTDNPLGYRQVSTGSDRGIDGGIWPAPEADRSFVQLFVEVDDVDASTARAEELGGRVVIPKSALPEGGEMAVVVDPEGVPVAVMKP